MRGDNVNGYQTVNQLTPEWVLALPLPITLLSLFVYSPLRERESEKNYGWNGCLVCSAAFRERFGGPF